MNAVSVAVSFLLPLALALLFAAGIRRWSLQEGSWMFLIGGILAAIAAAAGLLTVMIYAITEDRELLSDLRPGTWREISATFGFLAIGYFFVAYRAAAQRPRRRTGPRPRRRRPPSPSL